MSPADQPSESEPGDAVDSVDVCRNLSISAVSDSAQPDLDRAGAMLATCAATPSAWPFRRSRYFFAACTADAWKR